MQALFCRLPWNPAGLCQSLLSTGLESDCCSLAGISTSLKHLMSFSDLMFTDVSRKAAETASGKLARARKVEAQQRRTSKGPKEKRKQGRENKSTLHRLTAEERALIWEKVNGCHKTTFNPHFVDNSAEPIPFSDCWLSRSKLVNPTNGYGFFPESYSRFGLKSKVPLHVLALYIRTGEIADNPEVASHLCHRPACYNPEHLCKEHNKINLSRVGCLRALKTEEGEVYDLCPHRPSCKRRDTSNIPIGWTPTKK